MREKVALVASLMIPFPIAVSAQSAGPVVGDWVRETESASWTPRDSQGECVFRDRLWILGGWFNSYEAPPRDVWASSDGRRWQLVVDRAPWIHSDLAMTVVFDNRMWLMGGWYNGRLEGHSASNQVWSTDDGMTWRQETAAAPWSARIAGAVVEFRGRMWLMGGTENYYFGNAQSLKSDVWSSVDGVEWKLETPRAEWSPRAYHQAVVWNDRIYLFGGGNYVPEYHACHDVWSSADGVRWNRETDRAPWHPRLWFSAAVYRNHMWVLGGWSNDPAQNWGDVWYSRDGRQWEKFNSPTCWKGRHEHSAFVFQDKLWIAGGHATPLSNEVWSLYLAPEFGAHH